jgi:hypothetical protein
MIDVGTVLGFWRRVASYADANVSEKHSLHLQA